MSQLVAPVGVQTEYLPPVSDDTYIQGGQFSNIYNFGAPTLVVSTSPTAVHDNTSVALIKFPISATIAPSVSADVLTAVLELTVATPPAYDMLMTARDPPARACAALNSSCAFSPSRRRAETATNRHSCCSYSRPNI